MLVLDTNHLREFGKASQLGVRLLGRLERSNQSVATTIVCIEEQTRGWLAAIHSARDADAVIRAYRSFHLHVETSARWEILPWDESSSDLFHRLRREGVRIPTLDLRIACIVLAHDATLLTRNRVDFEKVPGLRVENWLD